jgi:WD40 repeat protein
VGLLDAATGAEKRRLSGGMSFGEVLCFSPDGGKLASMSFGSRDSGQILQVWDLATGAEKFKRKFVYATPLVFSPDSNALFGLLPDEGNERSLSLRLWDFAGGQDRTYKIDPPEMPESLTASPDGRMLAWANFEGTITLWDLAAHQVRRRFKEHSNRIPCLAFSPDGKTLAS